MSGGFLFFGTGGWDLGQVGQMIRHAFFSGDVNANNAILAADIRSASQNSGPLAGFRNKIINGACQVAQRTGATALVNNNVVYGGCDRIASAASSFTTLTATVAQGSSTMATSGFVQRISGTATGTGSIGWQYRIESKDTAILNGKTITFRAGTLSQDTGGALNVAITINKANAVDNFSAVTQIGSTATVSVPSAGNVPASNTVTLGATDGNNGLLVTVMFQSVGAFTNKNFHVGDLQLEVGSVASNLEHRPFTLELALCRRYYEKSYDLGTAAGSVTLVGAEQSVSATAFILSKGTLRYQVAKRTTPTVTIYSTNGGVAGSTSEYNAGSVFVADRACGLSTNGENGYELQVGGVATVGNYQRWHWTASAEL